MNLASANIVVVAQHFNPSILNQLWLARYGVVLENESQGDYAFTNEICQVQAPGFHFLAIPDRVQFTPHADQRNNQDLIQERLGNLIKSLPHTPYTAIGFNIGWHHEIEGDINKLTRKAYFRPDRSLYQHFDDSNARFGAYCSVDWLDFRMKTDVKPAIRSQGDITRDIISLSFNFHRELDRENAVGDIEDSLTKWNKAIEESSTIAKDAINDLHG
jgi:hypothetical protein